MFFGFFNQKSYTGALWGGSVAMPYEKKTIRIRYFNGGGGNRTHFRRDLKATTPPSSVESIHPRAYNDKLSDGR